MPRRALILLVAVCAVALAAVLAGCSPGSTTTPTPQTVIGKVALPPKAGKGNAAAGKAVFASQGCGACHTYAPAASTGKVGPDLDKLAADAQKAGQPLDAYVKTSITDPNAYVVPGFPKGVMPTFSSLTDQQLADLTAFLTQGS